MKTINFKKSQRAKYFRISVRADCSVTVTIPRGGTRRQAESFVKDKRLWIQKQINKAETRIKNQIKIDRDIDLMEAQKKIFKRLDYFSEKHSLHYRRAAFRCQRTIWGSCSARNNISLNINIAYLPEKLQDYILLHELVHTKIKNHSHRFWKQLDKYTQGQAKQLRGQLRKYSPQAMPAGPFYA